MKKIVSLLIISTIIFLSDQAIGADVVTRIYSDLNTYTDKSVDIPIKIENSSGLTAYKFTVQANNLMISDVLQGKAFSEGIFNYDISENKEDVEIVWSNNTVNKSDGEVFTIKADVKDSTKVCEVDLRYSPSDILDGNSEEADLACDLITIVPVDSKTQPTHSNTSYENQEQESLILQYINNVDNNDMKNISLQALVDIGQKLDVKNEYTIDEIKTKIDSLNKDEKNDFVKQFNQLIAEKNTILPVIPEKDGSAVIKEILDCTDEYTIKSATQPSEPILDEDATIVTDASESNVTNATSNADGWVNYVLIIAVCLVTVILITITIKKRREISNEI